MTRSECGLSKNDRRRLRKRNLADREEVGLEGQDGESEGKIAKQCEAEQMDRKQNEKRQASENNVIYPWMLEFRSKNKGNNLFLVFCLELVNFVLLCPPYPEI